MRKAITGIILSIWAFTATAETVTIAALGDSLTQGYGLPPEQGFVPQLQSWLDERNAGVKMINAGVSGDTTAGGAARVDWTLTPEVDGMVVILGGNDLLRGIDPALTQENLDKIMQVAADRDVAVLLIGMQAPDNYGPAYKRDFDGIYPTLAEAYGAGFVDSFFGGLAVDGNLSAARQFMQADGIHPNAEGVTLIVDALGPAILDLAGQSVK